MKADTRERLQGILDNYKQKQLELLLAHEETKNERRAFLESFARKLNGTIRPSFEEFGRLLKSKGHGLEITQKTETHDPQGNVQHAHIQLEILPNGYRARPGERPTIAFVADSARKEIRVEVSTIMSGCAGRPEVYTLDQITDDVVEDEVLTVLASCFG